MRLHLSIALWLALAFALGFVLMQAPVQTPVWQLTFAEHVFQAVHINAEHSSNGCDDTQPPDRQSLPTLRRVVPQSTAARRTFSRAQRLSRSADIAAVKQTGRRVKAGQIDVRIATSPLSCARVGIVVPKYKRSIVERNKLKRRLRELVRVKMLPVIKSQDVLIKTFPKAYEMTFDELAREIEKVVARIA